MILHSKLGATKTERSKRLAHLISAGEISLGGYMKGKIYGRLNCSSGKRMKTENRIFFRSEAEAIAAGYRPCGHCMREAYLKWKSLA